MSVAANINKIREEIPPHVKLVAVSKTKPVALIREAYDAGQRIFGENKVQEMVSKQPQLPADIEWHLIGHLQSNKVKYIAPFVSLIHSVDSLKLLEEIDKQGAKNQRVIGCLLQFHIAQEESKFGLDLEEARLLLESESFRKMQHVQIMGIMGMASFTENQEQVHKEFASLKNIFDKVKAWLPDNMDFTIVSMGMSGDYHIAIEEGANMIRVGSALFGERSYATE